MKSFLKTFIMSAVALLAILMIFAIGILGYKNVHALANGIINISLVLEFVGAVVIFAVLMGICKVVEQTPYFDEHEITIDDVQKEVERQKKISGVPFKIDSISDKKYYQIKENEEEE